MTDKAPLTMDAPDQALGNLRWSLNYQSTQEANLNPFYIARDRRLDYVMQVLHQLNQDDDLKDYRITLHDQFYKNLAHVWQQTPYVFDDQNHRFKLPIASVLNESVKNDDVSLLVLGWQCQQWIEFLDFRHFQRATDYHQQKPMIHDGFIPYDLIWLLAKIKHGTRFIALQPVEFKILHSRYMFADDAMPLY